MRADDGRRPDCDACPLGEAMERRAFVRSAAEAALAALVAVGVVSSRARALTVTFTTGIGVGAEKAYPIPGPDVVSIDRDESVIIARAGDRAYAFSLACPHQNTAIRWMPSDHRYQCPKHKSRYRPDGTFIEGRATRGLDRFALRREADRLLVNFDVLYREDRNAAEWASAFVDLVSREK